MGYSYEDAEHKYVHFDRFTIQHNETTIGITKDLAESWSKKRPNESDNTRYRRIMYLNLFASFLNDMGYNSYIAPYPTKYKSTFTPHILTKKEMHAIFEACDKLNKGTLMNSTVNVIPALIRLMYGTGIRIGEALSLKVKDVNLAKGYLVTVSSKNGKERLIPFTNSVRDACCQYRASLGFTQSPEDYFFVKRNGFPCCSKIIYEWFRKVLRKAGIKHGGKGYGPRLYDVRHTFSVHSMAAMAASGLDLYYSLPILSQYLGHQSLEATEKYVRLTSEMYPGLLKDAEQVCAKAYPEVFHDSN